MSSSLHGWKTGPLSAKWFIPHRTLFQQKCTFTASYSMCMYLFNIWYGRVSFVCSLCLQRFFPRPPASSHSPNTWMSGSFPLSPYDTWNSPPPSFLFLFCDNSLTGEAFRDSDRLISPNACSVVHILLSMFSWSCVCVVVKLCAFGFVGVRVRVCVCAHAVVVLVHLQFVWFACFHVWVNARLQVYRMCFALQRVCLLILLCAYSCEWNVCIR